MKSAKTTPTRAGIGEERATPMPAPRMKAATAIAEARVRVEEVRRAGQRDDGLARAGPAVDDQRAAVLADQLAVFAPKLDVLRFPAWDCLPYDRVSPVADIVARRLATLARLIQPITRPLVLITTVNAVLQRVVPRNLMWKPPL